MQKEATIEEFKQLPSIGETKARDLKDAGYTTFEDIVRANPMTIHTECNIVISSATHIISAAVEHVDGECPTCQSDELKHAWEEYSGSIPEDTDAEIVCDSCGWYGVLEELK